MPEVMNDEKYLDIQRVRKLLIDLGFEKNESRVFLHLYEENEDSLKKAYNAFKRIRDKDRALRLALFYIMYKRNYDMDLYEIDGHYYLRKEGIGYTLLHGNQKQFISLFDPGKDKVNSNCIFFNTRGDAESLVLLDELEKTMGKVLLEMGIDIRKIRNRYIEKRKFLIGFFNDLLNSEEFRKYRIPNINGKHLYEIYLGGKNKNNENIIFLSAAVNISKRYFNGERGEILILNVIRDIIYDYVENKKSTENMAKSEVEDIFTIYADSSSVFFSYLSSTSKEELTTTFLKECVNYVREEENYERFITSIKYNSIDVFSLILAHTIKFIIQQGKLLANEEKKIKYKDPNKDRDNNNQTTNRDPKRKSENTLEEEEFKETIYGKVEEEKKKKEKSYKND